MRKELKHNYVFSLSQHLFSSSYMRTAFCWVITKRVVVIPDRRFGTFPETSIRNYHHTLRNWPEERNSHPLRDGNLKSPRMHLRNSSTGWL